MKYKNIRREEELKNKVGTDFFSDFDCNDILQNIDFSVRIPNTSLFGQYLLWAEAKAVPTDIMEMLAQLVLTIGKARTFDKFLPPPFLGCFDGQKIAFIPYHEFQEIFYMNDFNWKVTSSDRETKEFKLIYDTLKKTLHNDKIFIFDFEKDENELKNFIKENFVIGKNETSKIRIDKNNFISVYNKWLEIVKPTIMLLNWNIAKKAGIIDGDFYLADLLSSENQTLKESLFVVLEFNKYIMNKHVNKMGLLDLTQVYFTDGQKAHTKFWAIYERPPKEEYWDFIIDRRDLIVPQDVRERKGSFYTPKIWVELSQKYIADVFGENWQEEYYVWDCAAGTGNLLAGLINKYNIWASTIDQADVDVMHVRIDTMNEKSISGGGANLLHDHVFQFDFLNDDFEKLPQKLQEIIKKTPEKLIIYINPPYAEAMNKRDPKNAKKDVNRTYTEKKYVNIVGKSIRELFIQFLIRAYKEIQLCKIANFAKLGPLISPNFVRFRENFQPKLEKLFVVPSYTFDNVPGKFPIGFHVWDNGKKGKFKKITANVYNENKNFIGIKTIRCYDSDKTISDWLKQYVDKETNREICAICCVGTDFQHSNFVNINHRSQLKGVGNAKGVAKFGITQNNIIQVSIYLAVRHCIKATWLNDRDQFLYPNNKWKKDTEFQNDCLAFTLFHNSNNISSKEGVNHWIPFFENEVNAREKFDSHFMLSFITGKIVENGYSNLFERQEDKICIKREFSAQAQAVFNAGRELWKYYHSKPKVNVNASFYDIREYFQGRNDKGKMNSKSEDEKYTELIGNLRSAREVLKKKIEPKIYEYGFLRE